MMPSEAALAMYSKWGVSPRIRQPRQTTAAHCPDSATRCAACASSYAPGTGKVSTDSSGTPDSCSTARAPASSRSVMNPWYCERTMAIRM